MEPYLHARRDRVGAAWALDGEVVLISAGSAVSIPGHGDQTFPFRPHSEYFYLADRERPDCVLAFDPREGWTDFVPEVSEKERVWTGGQSATEGRPLSQLEEWLGARRGRAVAVLGCPLDVEHDEDLGARLREILTHVRRAKDALELERMRHAARATAAGYARIRDLIGPGVSERALQIELEAEFFRAGGRRTAYDTIVAGGPNAAVLHFSPTRRELHAGELVLIDAGAECDGYACDVTRTYPVGRDASPEQRDLYSLVLEAQKAAIVRCRAGKEFRDLHLETAVDLTRGLVDFGLLRGEPQSLVEQCAHCLFFPHGLGHLVGLGVRDASGSYPGRAKDERPQLATLRVDLPLAAGYVVTIEPGLYFMPALLRDPERRVRYHQQVDWARADRMLDFGGIRIEDNVLVTAGEPEILTAAIPKDL